MMATGLTHNATTRFLNDEMSNKICLFANTARNTGNPHEERKVKTF